MQSLATARASCVGSKGMERVESTTTTVATPLTLRTDLVGAYRETVTKVLHSLPAAGPAPRRGADLLEA